MFYRKILFVVSVIGIASFLLAESRADAPRHTLEFVMAHKPDNPDNLALMQEFSDRIRERTNGSVNIKLKQPEDVLPQGRFSSYAWLDFIVDKVYTGETDMVQISAKKFAKLNTRKNRLDFALVVTCDAEFAVSGPGSR